MRVETVITSENRVRYTLVNTNGEFVTPVLKYLKFKDNSGSARNSLRSYCFHLKLFFEYLEEKNLDYLGIQIDDIAEFIRWLQSPFGNLNVTPMSLIEMSRSPRTINIVLSTVLRFYDYIRRHEEYNNQLSVQMVKQISGSKRGFKDFLYHINKNKKYNAKLFKIKVPKQKPKTIPKKDIETIINACNNIRDKFLIQLLWESSIRIGEALALWLEDFEIDGNKIHIRDRGQLENMAEIKTVCSPRDIDVSSDLINFYFDYIAECHKDEVDTNHVFIKLSGRNKYKPMEYQDVVSLFKRLGEKTGIIIMPHVLRHTSLTELRRAGWKDEHLMKRAGHAHIQTTLQMYVHPSDEDIRKDWENAQRNFTCRSVEE